MEHLQRCLAESMQRGLRLTERAAHARRESLVPADLFAPRVGGGPLGALQPSNALARTQLDHFKGWVYSSVRPIAQRIAGQPLRVARVKRSSSGSASISPAPAASAAQHMLKSLIPDTVKQLGDGGELTVLQSHALVDAIERPNPAMVRWMLLYVSVCSLEITGQTFWWMCPRDGKDIKNGFDTWPVPPQWMTPIFGGKSVYAGWTIRADQGAEPIDVPAEQIVYIWYPDPGNPLMPVSPLQAQSRAVITDEQIIEAQRRSFQAGIHPGVLLTVGRHPDVQGAPGQRPILTPRQRAQIIATIKAYYRGVANYDEPLILDGLIENATRFSTSNREMDYLSSGKMTKARISQGFGVNPIIMGEVEGANRSSAAVADAHFVSNTVNPKIQLISECLTAWMAPLFASAAERLLVYLEKARVYDPELELKKATALFDRGGMSINEFRALCNLAPVQGGEVSFVRTEMVPYLILPPGTTHKPEGYNPFFERISPSPGQAGQPPTGAPPTGSPGDAGPHQGGSGGDPNPDGPPAPHP